MMKSKNKYGQYMTPKIIAEFMISLANLNKDSMILEPSCGEGVFLDLLTNKGYANISAYEIDKQLINNNFNAINTSFVSAEISRKFDLIIGNPPYIRWKNLEHDLKVELQNNILWKKYCNSLCDYSAIFIIKSIELLDEGGQLIFITPEYWFNTTNSENIRNYMLKNGYFEEIYYFNEMPIFEKATVSTIIFKFIKTMGEKNKKIRIVNCSRGQKLNEDFLDNIRNNVAQIGVEYIIRSQFEENENWALAQDETISTLKRFEDKCRKKTTSKSFYTIRDFCDIGNGMVSGLDKAFQVHFDTNIYERQYLIPVVKAKDLEQFVYKKTTEYFLIKEGEVNNENIFIEKFPNFYNSIKAHIDALKKRYQYNRVINFWEWVFLRNYNLFSRGEARIFVPCKERISNKNHFRFSLVEEGIYPTQDVTAIFLKKGVEESIYYVLALLNSEFVFNWLRYKGIKKGDIIEFSEKPISNIPYRKIDFTNKIEKDIHDKIVRHTKGYISHNDKTELKNISIEFEKLFNI